jgi:hypothetical protein
MLPAGAFQAYGITRWLENGAFDALEKGYLKNISLRIHGGAGATGPTEENILERYDCESSACTRAVQAGVNSSHYSVEVNGALDGNVTVKQNGTTVSAFSMTRMRQETVRACVRARTSPIAPSLPGSQVILVRTLITMCNTMGSLPSDRWLTMRLELNDVAVRVQLLCR